MSTMTKRERRALSDASCAWRAMTDEQKVDFLEFVEAEHGVTDGSYLPAGYALVDPDGRIAQRLKGEPV